MYRPDLQRKFFEHAEKLGVKVTFGKKVVELNTTDGSCVFDDGTNVSSKLVICADGKLIVAMSDEG